MEKVEPINSSETGKVNIRNKISIPQRYYYVFIVVVISYLCHGINPQFVLIKGKSSVANWINVIIHALLRTLIATYVASIFHFLVFKYQQVFGINPDWAPFIRFTDIFLYVLHAMVPFKKIMNTISDKTDAILLAIWITIGITIFMLILRGIHILLKQWTVIMAMVKTALNIHEYLTLPAIFE